MPHNKFPSLIVLSAAPNGKVQCLDDNDEPLSLLGHGQSLACIFVPLLMVEQQLAYKDYSLYIFENADDLPIKINKIMQHEQDAILLIGAREQREIYYIEDSTLVFDTPILISCEIHLELIDELDIGPEGKVTSQESYYRDTVITLLRNAGHRGNEAEISGTRVGLNVFSRDFSPCNAIVAKRKLDNQFVLHHSTSASMDKTRPGVELFMEGIEDGFSFAAVMQNPRNKKNYLKAPMLAAQLAIQLHDENISRINIPEGYGAIACINGDTIIMAQRMEFFKSELDKRTVIGQLKTKSEETTRFIELDNECLSLPETAKELRGQLLVEENSGMRAVYRNLLGQLGLFATVQKDLPQLEQKSRCTLI
ncbi:hypothetical protein J2N86_01085 [Legionella lytica]|uniref:Uncharacterized protein n=1 Tax=Legionella lytica TaxID=96232 RepID=A0ABY4Y8Q6_9GAMM|nr:hypothetical protein [Legionella lytica]USQ13975.1 hypothetical protein J2N86_01085 [Legionella lytica]